MPATAGKTSSLQVINKTKMPLHCNKHHLFEQLLLRLLTCVCLSDHMQRDILCSTGASVSLAGAVPKTPGIVAHGCYDDVTGTNFLVRAQAVMEVGGSPMYTMTEDYALGMELKKFGWHCRYVQEYLAIGEAPHEVRNMYQQRSRWTKVSFKLD